MSNRSDPIEVTPEEAIALQTAWNSLAPLLAFAIRELGREDGLKLCAGLAQGDLLPTWTLTAGRAFCVISRSQDVIYSFEFLDSPRRFVFAELGPPN